MASFAQQVREVMSDPNRIDRWIEIGIGKKMYLTTRNITETQYEIIGCYDSRPTLADALMEIRSAKIMFAARS